MEYLDLRGDDKAAYLATLRQSHHVRSLISIYDRDEVELGRFQATVTDGQINLDASADILRQLSLTIEDPRFSFSFSPLGNVYADKFIGVDYGVYVPDLGWVDVPVFRGPCSRYSRNGHTVQLEAVGKEALMMAPVKQLHLPNPDDRKVVTYIRSVAADFGETLFDLGDAGQRKVPKDFELDPAKARENGTWWYLRQLAASVNMELLYGGDGRLRLRPHRPNTIIHTFRDVLTLPTVGYDLTEVRNSVEVYGKDKPGHDVMKARRDLAASHPLSAQSLGRGGKPRVLVEQIKLDNAKLTAATANKIADTTLRRRSQQVVDVQFDSLPIPHLEVRDVVRLLHSGIDVEFSVSKFSLPLGPATMSMGYTRSRPLAAFRSVRRRVPKHRHHKKKGKGKD